MSSAIELYQKAYDLDYNRGDLEYAEELYKEIINRYPHSEEKEYAQVNLERIANLKSNPNDPFYKPFHSGGLTGLTVFCFILVLFLSVGVGFLGYFLYKGKQRQDSYELLLHGMIFEQNGNPDNARSRYEHAQKLYPANSLAYRCLGELYLKNGNIDLAEIESKKWKLANPYDINISDFISDIEKHRIKRNNKNE